MPAKAKDRNKAPIMAGPFDSKQVATLDHDHELVFMRFSPCGQFLFGGSYDSNIYRWELSPGEAAVGELTDGKPPEVKAKVTLAAHKAWVQGIVFHPDKKQMFTGDSWGNLCCWNYADASPKPTWTRPEGHSRWMRSLAISADGSLLATCGADKIVKLWSTADGSLKWESPVQANDLHSVQFHPKGDLVVGDLMGNVTHWDLATKKTVRTLDAKILHLRGIVEGVLDINDVGGVRVLTFDRAGKYLACAGAEPATSGFFTAKPCIVLMEWETGKSQILQWEGVDATDGITLDAIWHPDGYLIAGSSGQAGKGALYCWKPGEKVPLYLDKKMVNCRSLSLHPDGKKLAVAQVGPAAGRSGNGRHSSQEADYLGYVSKVRIFEKA